MNTPSPDRAVAIAVPAHNEEVDLPACLASLDQAAAHYAGDVSVVVLANNCSDRTVDVLRSTRLRHAQLDWWLATLLPGARHAGWARRLAFDAAASKLRAASDVLASTDADTVVTPDWLSRTVGHLDHGASAVAGRALTLREHRAELGSVAVRRLNMLGRYYTALDWLRADLEPERHDPWPRHFYEGGASIALTLDLYRRMGGAPTPPVAEDRALFDAVRAHDGRVRHPIDVRVFTSSRTKGRASGGMADAFARWIAQPEDAPLHETYMLPRALEPGGATDADRLSFRSLPGAIAAAAAMIRLRRSAQAPEVEPILLPPLFGDDRNLLPDPFPKLDDRLVA